MPLLVLLKPQAQVNAIVSSTTPKERKQISANSYCAKTVFEHALRETVKQEFGGIPHNDNLLNQDQQGQLIPMEVSPLSLRMQPGLILTLY